MSNPTYLDKLASFVERFKPNLCKALWDRYKKVKELSHYPRPQDDSITLQELLQQLLCCWYTKESLYHLIFDGFPVLNIDIS